jgi:uncharacterized protein (TIGR02145 family)
MESGFRGSTSYRNDPLGKKMRSTTPINGQVTNGTSKSAATGGFDALLVGYVISGNRFCFGEYTRFWSSSSNSGTGAWNRLLIYSNEGVFRDNNSRSNRFSVRCKKD